MLRNPMIPGNHYFIKNHIPNQTATMKPITRLTKNVTIFKWDQEQEESFNATRVAAMNAKVCMYPNLPYIILPDASQKYTMGAMLAQVQGGLSKLLLHPQRSSKRLN